MDYMTYLTSLTSHIVHPDFFFLHSRDERCKLSHKIMDIVFKNYFLKWEGFRFCNKFNRFSTFPQEITSKHCYKSCYRELRKNIFYGNRHKKILMIYKSVTPPQRRFSLILKKKKAFHITEDQSTISLMVG